MCLSDQFCVFDERIQKKIRKYVNIIGMRATAHIYEKNYEWSYTVEQ